MKKATKILIGLMIVAFTVTSAFAAIEKPDNYKKEIPLQKNCKTCHVKSASDKTMGQWERIYKKVSTEVAQRLGKNSMKRTAPDFLLPL